MANKTHIVPLKFGISERDSDTMLEAGFVRRAHNVEVDSDGGLKRLRGLARMGETDLSTTTQSGGYTFMQVGTYLYAFCEHPTTPLDQIVSRVGLPSSKEVLEYDSGSTEKEYPWNAVTVYNNVAGSSTSATVHSEIVASGLEAFTSYNTDTDSAWAVTNDGEILWYTDKLRVQNQAADFPPDWSTAAGTGNTECAAVLSDRLWIGTRWGKVRVSHPGSPWNFDSYISNGAEYDFDSSITNIVPLSDDTMFVSTLYATYILYNTGDAGLGQEGSFEIRTLSHESGGVAGTAQRIGNDIYYVGRGGIYRVSATEQYGNFSVGSASKNLYSSDLLTPTTPSGHNWIDSTVSSLKSQYILFDSPPTNTWSPSGSGFDLETHYHWEDAIGYIGHIGDREDGQLSWTSFDKPNMTTSVGNQNLLRCRYRNLEAWFVSVWDEATSRYIVMRWQDGFDWDGAEYTSQITTRYEHCDSPYVAKTFKKVIAETYGFQSEDMKVYASFDDGFEGVPTFSADATIALKRDWRVDSDGTTTFDTHPHVVRGKASAYLGSNGESISITLSVTSDAAKPFSVQNLAIVYENRRGEH